MAHKADPQLLLSRRAMLLASLLPGACATGPGTSPLHPFATRLVEGQQAHSLQLPGRPQPLRSWLYLPPGYHASAAQGARWPLVIFLHGSGQRGLVLSDVLVHGPPQRVAQGAAYPFILCSPQLAQGRWDAQVLHAWLPLLKQELRVDTQRVMATGLSLGGHGVWEWAAAHPGDLAAIAPVCGFGDPAAVCQGRSVPVRAYHGEQDTVVPLARQQACVQALQACGGAAELTVYPGVGHDAWTRAYQDPGLVPWLLAQRQIASA